MMIILVDVHEANFRLSRLLAHAETGDEVVITRRGKPIVRLLPCERTLPTRRFGAMRGQITVDERFVDPLPEAELVAWE